LPCRKVAHNLSNVDAKATSRLSRSVVEPAPTVMETQRAVIVTGASSGIGFEIARTLTGHGFHVFGGVRREQDSSRLREIGVIPILLDVTDVASIASAKTAVEQNLKGRSLWALINNAGIPCAGPIEHVPLSEFRNVFETNVIGAIAVTQAFLPLLLESRGIIVNISSVSGSVAQPFLGPYAASKAALEALSDSLRRELIPTGVRVVVVQPGSVQTPIWDKVEALDLASRAGSRYEEVLSRVRTKALAGGRRGLHPRAVADAVWKVVTTTNPPTRVLVVRSRFKTWLSRVLPDKTIDRIVARRLWR